MQWTDTFVDDYDFENSKLDTAIKLYGFGKTVFQDISKVAEDDFEIVYKQNSTRLSSLDPNPSIDNGYWPNGRKARLRSRLHIGTSRSSWNPWGEGTKHYMRCAVDVDYRFNGRSVMIDGISGGPFQDQPGWEVRAEVSTFRIKPRKMDGDFVALLLVRCRFIYIQGIVYDTVKAKNERFVTLDSLGRTWSKWGQWPKRYYAE